MTAAVGQRPELLIVFTGGTISCTLDPERGVPVPTMSGEQILESVPQIHGVAAVQIDDFGRYPGPHMHPERVVELSRRISRATDDGRFAGVVVTHGTDSIEETAFLLDRILSPLLPVVILGSMKLADDPCWDGPANLLAACQVAAHPDSRGRGVMVVMADQIHAAAWVTKLHAESLEAFGSPQVGPLGVVDRGRVIFFAPPTEAPLPRFDVDRIEPAVDLVKAVVGADGRHVEASMRHGAKGLVVEGMGRGNLPPELAVAVMGAAACMPVVIASRCSRGRAIPMYGYDGGAARLAEAGVIFADHLSGLKARLLLMLALGDGADAGAIRQMFEGNRYD